MAFCFSGLAVILIPVIRIGAAFGVANVGRTPDGEPKVPLRNKRGVRQLSSRFGVAHVMIGLRGLAAQAFLECRRH